MLAITSKFQGFYFAALTRFIALFYALVLLVSLSCLTPAQTSYAQDRTAIVTAPEGLTLRSIAREKDRLQNNSELTATQVETAAASYDTAETSFNSAQDYLSRVAEDVTALQRLTGQRRKIEARRLITQTQTTLANMKAPQDVNAPPTHPLLLEYAAENLALTEQLYTIAEQAGRLPQRKAKRRSQIDILQADLTTADSLISLGNLSRQSATTLRQLRNDNETVGKKTFYGRSYYLFWQAAASPYVSAYGRILNAELAWSAASKKIAIYIRPPLFCHVFLSPCRCRLFLS